MSPVILQDKHYSLSITQRQSSTSIYMQMLSPLLTTTHLPHTHSVLSDKLPNIHTSRCFNNKHLPFSEEVRNTEIGHLFEHILLEYVYQMKVLRKEKNTLIQGETRWNWQRDPQGLFHIIVNLGSRDKQIFFEALKKSIELLNKILN